MTLYPTNRDIGLPDSILVQTFTNAELKERSIKVCFGNEDTVLLNSFPAFSHSEI